MYSQGLSVCEPVLTKVPWHWYLRSHVAGQYVRMAECYERVGDYQNEVRAWRGYLKAWGGPFSYPKWLHDGFRNEVVAEAL